MKFKLNKAQFDYLEYSLTDKKQDLRSKLQVNKEDKFIFVEVTEEVADEIRDWAGKELQKRGFDINYHLTPEGEILEDLIDIFYIE